MDKTKSLSNETITKLNEFNPIDESIEINNNITSYAKIKSVKIPSIDKLLDSESPFITLKLTHEKIVDDLTLKVFIDAFTSNNNQFLLSELLSYYNLDINSITKLKNKKLPVKIKRHDDISYELIPDIDSYKNPDVYKLNNDNLLNTKYKNLYLVLKAQKYNKAKIKEIIELDKDIKVGFEIPFCNKIKYIYFSKERSEYKIMFSSLVQYILNRPPISVKEYNVLLNKEIKMSYIDGFDIDKNIKNETKSYNYTFFQFIDNNRKTVLNKFLYFTGIFTLLYSLTPLAMIPIYISNSYNMFIFILIFFSIISIVTGIDIHKKYKNR